jgi:hypothetical protein
MDTTIMLPKLRAVSIALGGEAGDHWQPANILDSKPPEETITSAANKCGLKAAELSGALLKAARAAKPRSTGS